MILAFDTSTQWMGIAIFDSASILFEKIWKTQLRHTVELIPALKKAMQESGGDFSSLKAVAVAIGPGSFTSLRIGLAAAKGLNLSLGIPVIGVPSLDITAYGQPQVEELMICVLKAGRGRFAAQEFYYEGGWHAKGDIFTTTVKELESRLSTRTILRGEINQEERKILERRWRNALVANPAENIRRPAHLAEIAWSRLVNNNTDDIQLLEPIYINTAGLQISEKIKESI